jgi:hypothetical protein
VIRVDIVHCEEARQRRGTAKKRHGEEEKRRRRGTEKKRNGEERNRGEEDR